MSLLARVEAIESELPKIARKIAQARFDLEYPPGHAERERMMPDILRPKKEPETTKPSATVGVDLKPDEASR